MEKSASGEPTSSEGRTDRIWFSQQAAALYKKYDLEIALHDPDKVFGTACDLLDRYQVPKEFLNDEFNFALVLGCGEKLSSNLHPLFARRVENFFMRLVQPVVSRNVIDPDELWGKDPDSGGLSKEEAKKYLESKFDPEATEDFKTKHKKELDDAVGEWKERGVDLNINIKIISDEVTTFRHNLRAGGYIDPDKKAVEALRDKVGVVEVVLLKDYFPEHIVRHELYHIADYFNFIRRGYGGAVLEGLDELHTEFAVGNYQDEEKGQEEARSSYFGVKEYWNRVSYNTDLPFEILADRNEAASAIIRKSGFSGFLEHALLHAHGRGKAAVFESFYDDEERAVFTYLLESMKLDVVRSVRDGKFDTAEQVSAIKTLITWMIPDQSLSYSRYRGLYEIVPTKSGRVMAARYIEPYNSQVDNSKAKLAILSLFRALAYLDLSADGLVDGSENETLLKVLDTIPIIRLDEGSSSVEIGLQKKLAQRKEYNASLNEEDFWSDKIYSLYGDMRFDVGWIDFCFSLINPDARNIFLQAYHKHLDDIASFVISRGSQEDVKNFADGIFGQNTSWELRETAIDYWTKNYPELAPTILARKAKYDSRYVRNAFYG